MLCFEWCERDTLRMLCGIYDDGCELNGYSVYAVCVCVYLYQATQSIAFECRKIPYPHGKYEAKMRAESHPINKYTGIRQSSVSDNSWTPKMVGTKCVCSNNTSRLDWANDCPDTYTLVYTLSCLTYMISPIPLSVLHIFLSLRGTGEHNSKQQKSSLILYLAEHSTRPNPKTLYMYPIRLLQIDLQRVFVSHTKHDVCASVFGMANICVVGANETRMNVWNQMTVYK